MHHSSPLTVTAVVNLALVAAKGILALPMKKHAVGPSPSKPHSIHALLICWNHISLQHFEIVGYRDQPGPRYLLQFFHNSAPGVTH